MREALRAFLKIWVRSEQLALGAAGLIFALLLVPLFLGRPWVDVAVNAIAFIFLAVLLVSVARRIRIQTNPERHRAQVAHAKLAVSAAYLSLKRRFFHNNRKDAKPPVGNGTIGETRHGYKISMHGIHQPDSQVRPPTCSAGPIDHLCFAAECAARGDSAETLSILSRVEAKWKVTARRDKDIVAVLRAAAFYALGQSNRSKVKLSTFKVYRRSSAVSYLAAQLNAQDGYDQAGINNALKELAADLGGRR